MVDVNIRPEVKELCQILSKDPQALLDTLGAIVIIVQTQLAFDDTTKGQAFAFKQAGIAIGHARDLLQATMNAQILERAGFEVIP